MGSCTSACTDVGSDVYDHHAQWTQWTRLWSEHQINIFRGLISNDPGHKALAYNSIVEVKKLKYLIKCENDVRLAESEAVKDDAEDNPMPPCKKVDEALAKSGNESKYSKLEHDDSKILDDVTWIVFTLKRSPTAAFFFAINLMAATLQTEDKVRFDSPRYNIRSNKEGEDAYIRYGLKRNDSIGSETFKSITPDTEKNDFNEIHHDKINKFLRKKFLDETWILQGLFYTIILWFAGRPEMYVHCTTFELEPLHAEYDYTMGHTINTAAAYNKSLKVGDISLIILDKLFRTVVHLFDTNTFYDKCWLKLENELLNADLQPENYHELWLGDIMPILCSTKRMPNLVQTAINSYVRAYNNEVNRPTPQMMVTILFCCLDQISQENLEYFIFTEDDRNNNDKEVEGTELWKHLTKIVKFNKTAGHRLMNTEVDLLRRILTRVPRLMEAYGVTCSLKLNLKNKNKNDEIKISKLVRAEWKLNELVFFDPTIAELKVCAPSLVHLDDISHLVPTGRVIEESTLQAYLHGNFGVRSCNFCKGYGSIDLFENMTDSERLLEEKEMKENMKSKAFSDKENSAIKAKFKIAFEKRDFKGLRNALYAMPSLAPQSRLKRFESGIREKRIRWLFATNWEQLSEQKYDDFKEEEIPYGGDIQAAMKAQDREAIKTIMKAKAKIIKLKDAQPVMESKNITWRKFAPKLCETLESAYNDSFGSIVQVYLPEENIHVRLDCQKFIMYDEIQKLSRQMKREEKELSIHDKTTKEPCWICKGSGRTSSWVENNGLGIEDQIADPGSEKMCLICYSEPGKYGMSIDCEHLYCEECIHESLKAMLNLGQFPPYCTMCRADGHGKQPTTGKITRPVLTFLQERGVFSKSFQFRFVAGMMRVGDHNSDPINVSETINCPAGCGTVLYIEEPIYRIIDGTSILQLSGCPCGAHFCMKCEELCNDSLVHDCKALQKEKKMPKNDDKLVALDQEAFALASQIGKACPVCGMFIEKNDGCEWMMCGCNSHGKLAVAMRNGGCGIAFNWNSMKVADDPCGYKDMDEEHVRGRPMTARQFKNGNDPKTGKPWQKCARRECNFAKCTDGIRLKHHNGVPSNKPSNGGEYCCSVCKDGGKGHSKLCHRISSGLDMNDVENQLETCKIDANKMMTKYVMPFDATYIRLVWKDAHNFLMSNDNAFYLQVLGVGSCLLRIYGANSIRMVASANKIALNSPHSPSLNKKLVSPFSFADREGKYISNDRNILDIFLGSEQRITGFTAKYLHCAPFKLYHKNAIEDLWVPYSVKNLQEDHLENIPDELTLVPMQKVNEIRRKRAESEEAIDLERKRKSAEILEKEKLAKLQKELEDAKKLEDEKTAKIKSNAAKLSKALTESVEVANGLLKQTLINQAQLDFIIEKLAIGTNQEKVDVKAIVDNMEREMQNHELKVIMGNMLVQCPACGFLIEKAEGDDSMMCGCEARPAGGTLEKAFLSGGCGHEFHYRTLAAQGTGAQDDPANNRQWKFTVSYTIFAGLV
jgi:hypothetical protein